MFLNFLRNYFREGKWPNQTLIQTSELVCLHRLVHPDHVDLELDNSFLKPT